MWNPPDVTRACPSASSRSPNQTRKAAEMKGYLSKSVIAQPSHCACIVFIQAGDPGSTMITARYA